jgi:Ribosomal protein L11 methyltransferase (PrmA)
MSGNHEQRDVTRLLLELTGVPQTLDIQHPEGTFALTPASRIAVQAIGRNWSHLAGTGLDWGCGSGCLAIAAATIPAVERVVGLDIVEANVAVARTNAAVNGVADKTVFIQSDSYAPSCKADRDWLEMLTGQISFILANPPASDGDDGFEYRRIVLKGARRFLAAGGVVYLNISLQYGKQRIEGLTRDISGFTHHGALASTDWVPFDLERPDLLQSLEDYAAEEARGGMEYSFRRPAPGSEQNLNARSALARFHDTGESPLSQWQVHLFEFNPGIGHPGQQAS